MIVTSSAKGSATRTAPSTSRPTPAPAAASPMPVSAAASTSGCWSRAPANASEPQKKAATPARAECSALARGL